MSSYSQIDLNHYIQTFMSYLNVMIVLSHTVLIKVACDNLIISLRKMRWGHVVSFSLRTRSGGHKKVDTMVFVIILSFFDPTIEKGERERT